MKLSKLAIGLAAVLAFSAQANATTFNLGALAAPSSDAIAGNVGAGSFTDYFDFSVPDSIVNSVITSVSLFNYTGINNLDIALFTSGGTLLAPGYQATTPLAPGVVVSAAVTFPYALTAGSYSLHVTGTGLTGGGSFGGNLNVAAVPEPTEGALLMSGLGLMGFIAARRNRKA